MTKNNYCTLFDSFYLTRGLAMYESLKKYSHDFHLYIFAFDDRSYEFLIYLQLDFVSVISLDEFEDEELLKIKHNRTKGEYCWTCTPSIIKYSIEKYQLTDCTYLDADLYFFADPSILIDEMNDLSVMITEHRYTPIYDKSTSSGIYCVQFVTFKNDIHGMMALDWWCRSCNTWCYSRYEDGKFGDQMYLDDWLTRFKNVHVLQHLGGGVAPWNVQQYIFSNQNNVLVGLDKFTGRAFDLIFYHFHALRFLPDKKIDLSVYELNKSHIELIYKPYIRHIVNINQKVDQYFIFEQVPVSIAGYGVMYIMRRIRKDWLLPIKYIYRKFFSRNNVISIKSLLMKS